MPSIIVLGTQWGDEGKGKIIDFLSSKADSIIRAQGGHNAGHTVLVKNKEFKLHLIPSGILHPHTQCYIGSGVVVNPHVFWHEVEYLKSNGINVENRLHLSDSAHILFSYHKYLDTLAEQQKKNASIGTTLSGIGPCYADKINRIGIRVGELTDLKQMYKKLKQNVEHHNKVIKEVYGGNEISLDEIYEEISDVTKKIKPFICSWEEWSIHQQLKKNKKILLEGAQGTFLDINWGTYPFVTSSSTIASGICSGAGLGPLDINQVMGVVKAYTTRVGQGPLPTFFERVEGFPLQKEAKELGTTTGRVRRMGWLDLILVKQAIEINSVNQIALTKIDILDRLKTIKICVGYKIGNTKYKKVVANTDLLEEVEPIYETLPGWEEPTTAMLSYEELPKNAKNYIHRIEEFCDCEVSLVSVGPARSQIIERKSVI